MGILFHYVIFILYVFTFIIIYIYIYIYKIDIYTFIYFFNKKETNYKHKIRNKYEKIKIYSATVG